MPGTRTVDSERQSISEESSHWVFLLRARHGSILEQRWHSAAAIGTRRDQTARKLASIEEREIRNMTNLLCGTGDIAICDRKQSEPVHRERAAPSGRDRSRRDGEPGKSQDRAIGSPAGTPPRSS